MRRVTAIARARGARRAVERARCARGGVVTVGATPRAVGARSDAMARAGGDANAGVELDDGGAREFGVRRARIAGGDGGVRADGCAVDGGDARGGERRAGGGANVVRGR